jgi:metallo-beta-lactamase family protein
MRVRFLGAAQTVTGSRYLVSANGSQVLVDCGLYQGVKNLRLRNRQPLPVPVTSIDAVALTHAHVDHSGFLPALHRQGYRGPVYCSAATLDLCKVLLPDAGFLQEEDARYANRKHFSRHSPAEPLFTEDDARRAVDRFRGTKHFHEDFGAWRCCTVKEIEDAIARDTATTSPLKKVSPPRSKPKKSK